MTTMPLSSGPAPAPRKVRVVERGQGERGVVLVLMALCLVCMMMFAGLMVDL